MYLVIDVEDVTEYDYMEEALYAAWVSDAVVVRYNVHAKTWEVICFTVTPVDEL